MMVMGDGISMIDEVVWVGGDGGSDFLNSYQISHVESVPWRIGLYVEIMKYGCTLAHHISVNRLNFATIIEPKETSLPGEVTRNGAFWSKMRCGKVNRSS